jgi:hypothetical protein
MAQGLHHLGRLAFLNPKLSLNTTPTNQTGAFDRKLQLCKLIMES